MLSPSSTRTYVRLGFLASVALTSFLLAARYQLSQPQDRPHGLPVQLGRQAWQVSFAAKSPAEAEDVALGAGATANGTAGDEDEDWDEDNDWGDWGVSTVREKWDPLRADSTPFTELQVKTCVLSPGLYDLCSPTSSAREDATRGVWERIDRDVSKKIGIYYLYIYGRRLLPGSAADVITDVRLLDHSPSVADLSSDGLWVEVSESLRTGVWPRLPPLFLHYKLTPQADVLAARKMDVNGSAGVLEPITEFDVLYGANETNPLPGYTKLPTMITGGPDDDKAIRPGDGGKGTRVGASLAYRKAIPKLPATPILRFSLAGNFTILQVADLHFSVGPGKCRDLDPVREADCQRVGADVYSLRWLEEALDEIKPDLVVLSGDQLNGQETSWDARSVILKWAPLLYERGIPWTTIFGNHDHESTDLDHEAQMELMRQLPLFLGESGPASVDGTGNYVRSIRAPEEDKVLFNMYFLDSHANAKSVNPWAKAGYDYLKPSQINWFRGRSAQMKTLMRPYTPPVKTFASASAFATSNRRPRPGRPGSKSSSSSSTSAASDLSVNDLRRRVRRQTTDENDGDWTVAAVDELTKLEEEMLENGDAGFSTAVEPDDGSQVGEESLYGEDGSTYEEDGADVSAADNSGSGTQEEDLIAEGELNPLLEDEQLMEEGGLEPTELPAGPTKANPMEAKPNAMVFFHIPLQQAYISSIDVGPSGKRLIVGSRLDGSGASKTDSGFFEQAVLAQGELPASKGAAPVDEFWDGEYNAPTEGRAEVKVLAHGHCHLTSDCRRVRGVWECFGGGGTYSGYGNETFARRFRVYQLSDYGERIETFQLLDTKERVNHAILVGEGSLEEE
ncbi:hypothetical protein JCM1840_006407 [Sporobolomyces johnsonii]